MLSYGEDPESLSHLGLVYHRVVTDRQTDGQTDRETDRIPIANTRSQQYLPVQLSRLKIHLYLFITFHISKNYSWYTQRWKRTKFIWRRLLYTGWSI